MTATVLPFSRQPDNFVWLDNEPQFDPSVHLQLELPENVLTLSELGYSDAEIARTATPVAATSAFRVLSDAGAEVLLQVAQRLEQFTAANPRIERAVRSGCHRSRWLRDTCMSPDVTAHLCAIYGVDIAPHPIASQLGHLNYSPSEVGEAVDKWHHDTLALDYVMMVADPSVLDGGDFEYFLGTKFEVEEMAQRGERPPPDRCVAVEWPGAGYAVALHGNMVVHRGAPLRTVGERISMVNGYIATDVMVDDQTRNRDLFHVDDSDVLARDWARYAAWRARQRLDVLIDGFSSDSASNGVEAADAASQLSTAVEDISVAVVDLAATELAEIHHYETKS